VLAVVLGSAGTAAAQPDEPPPQQVEVGFEARLALLIGEATQLSPRAGFGFGLHVHRQILRAGGLGLAAGADFGYDRFTETVHVRVLREDGSLAAYDDTQQLTHTSFVLAARARYDLPARFALLVGAGAGFSVSHFYRPPDGVNPLENDTAVVPLGRLCAGAALDVRLRTGIELQGCYTVAGANDRIRGVRPFGDVVDVGLGATYHF
jgi:hypothetical protein